MGLWSAELKMLNGVACGVSGGVKIISLDEDVVEPDDKAGAAPRLIESSGDRLFARCERELPEAEYMSVSV